MALVMVLLRPRHRGNQAAKPGGRQEQCAPSHTATKMQQPPLSCTAILPTLRLVFHFLALVAPVCASNCGQAGEMAPVLAAQTQGGPFSSGWQTQCSNRLNI